jgi:peptidoglycan/xylan/chitin deacetylase (PgdA/CDA1 family)
VAAGAPEQAPRTQQLNACDVNQSPGFLVALDSLRTWLGASMGDPLECAQPSSPGNELLQRTTTGAAFFDRTLGEASFTDGYRRWAIGPDGQRFWASPDAAPQAVEQPPLSRPVRCPVLYAHEVRSQASLRSLLTSLQGAGYQLTSLAAVDRAMSGQADTPPGCLVLSFDDALYTQYTNALPVLAAFGLPAVFFAMPAFNDGVHRYMGAEEIRALVRAGHEIGAHTCNHPSLPRLRVMRPVAFLAEVQDCKRTLESITGVSVVYFAYPNGSFDGPVAEAVATSGYRAAFTTRPAALLSPSSAFALPRIRIDVGEAPQSVLRRIRAAGG